MAIKLNWDRVKQLRTDLESEGWKDQDKLFFILIVKNSKPKKATITFSQLYQFCWDMMEDESIQIVTFIIQDLDGKVLYRHRQVNGNEEIPNGGNIDVILCWASLTQNEKNMYVAMLVAQINAYEK